MRDVLADNREGLPERIGLESQDDLHARPLSYVADEGKVPPKQVFLEDVAGGKGARSYSSLSILMLCI